MRLEPEDMARTSSSSSTHGANEHATGSTLTVPPIAGSVIMAERHFQDTLSRQFAGDVSVRVGRRRDRSQAI